MSISLWGLERTKEQMPSGPKSWGIDFCHWRPQQCQKSKDENTEPMDQRYLKSGSTTGRLKFSK